MSAEDQTPDRLAYTVKEACAISTLGRTQLYQLLSENRIESRLVGKRRLIIAASLRRFIEGGE